ncbi:MAG TPA: hypothetical protein VFZ40_05700 [Pyrinomonadaceae bacterium]
MLDGNSQAEIQPILDELLRKEMIPFALTSSSVQANGLGEYLVAFNDSRIHSCRFSWKEGEDFNEAFRAAIIARVNRRSGPLG